MEIRITFYSFEDTHKRRHINTAFVKRIINIKIIPNLHIKMHGHNKSLDATNVMNSSN